MSNDQLNSLIKGLHGAPAAWSDIDARVDEMKTKLDQFYATGVPSQVADLKTRFAKVQKIEAKCKADHPRTPTLVCSLNITKELNRIFVIMRDAPPAITTIDGIDKWKNDLSNQIDSAVNAVLLTNADCAKLKSELNAVTSAEPKGAKTSATPEQIQTLSTSLQAVSAHFDQMLKMAQSCISDLNRREVDIQIRIDNGERSQSLPHAAATGFRQKLDQITRRQSNYVEMNTDAPLSVPQVFDIANLIDQLQAQVDQASSPPAAANAKSSLSPEQAK